MNKTYNKHNSENIDEGWDAVREYALDAILIAWDECHKIYLAMDEDEAQFFRENYQPAVVEGASPDEMVDTIEEWWSASCPLRFVSAVWRNSEDPNEGFVSLISQFAGDDEDDEEEV